MRSVCRITSKVTCGLERTYVRKSLRADVGTEKGHRAFPRRAEFEWDHPALPQFYVTCVRREVMNVRYIVGIILLALLIYLVVIYL